MQSMRTLRSKSIRRNGNVLVGCLVALGIALVLLIIAIVFVVISWRGWVASGVREGMTSALNATQIEQVEKNEIMIHIDALMTRFENKEVSVEDLFAISEKVVDGPLLPAAIVAASYEGYFTDSELSDEQKADAKLQLTRVAKGMFDEDISIDELKVILTPIEAPRGSGGGDVIHIQIHNQSLTLKDPDDVTPDELLTLAGNARLAADEAGVDEVPAAIDLSDEVGIAIAEALGEDQALWLEGGESETPDAEPGEDSESATDDEPGTGDEPGSEDETDDGP